MSGALDAVIDYLDVFKANTTIDDITPDVTFSTFHRDDLVITRHPVEQGAAITDHAFKEPPEVEIRIGFSDTGGYSGSLLDGSAAIKLPGYTKQIYQKLIALQESRRLIDVSTGKRLYKNCLIAGVSTETAEGFVFSSIVSLRIREVQIARLSISPVPEKALQATPQTSGGVTDNGTVTPTPAAPANQSALSKIFSTSSGSNAPATALTSSQGLG